MSDDRTIAQAAEQALNMLGGNASLDELYDAVISNELYSFNSPTPKHVLLTELKRYIEDSPRSDHRPNPIFQMNTDQKFSLVEAGSAEAAESKARGPRRIMRAKDKEPLIQELMSEQVGVFREIWRLLLFAAQVGVSENRRETLTAVEQGKGIDQATFGNASSWPGIVYLFALVEAGDSSMFDSSDQGDSARVELFQEYANGGLSVIQEYYKDKTIDFDSFIGFIECQTAKGMPRKYQILKLRYKQLNQA